MLAPVGAASYAEALRWGVETYHALKGAAARPWALDRRRRRRRLRAGPALERGGVALLVGAIEAAGYTPGDEIALASMSRRPSSTATAATCSPARAPTTRPSSGPTGWSSCATATRSCRSRTAWPRTTGTAGARSPSGSATACNSWRRPVRHQRRPDRGGHRARRRELGADQGQPDRDALRDARHDARGLRRRPPMMSHRSGETEDTTIADLAVATNSGRSRAACPRQRARRQAQPAPAHRGRARPGGRVPLSRGARTRGTRG